MSSLNSDQRDFSNKPSKYKRNPTKIKSNLIGNKNYLKNQTSFHRISNQNKISSMKNALCGFLGSNDYLHELSTMGK